jgi:Flp pilus assembly protein TadD
MSHLRLRSLVVIASVVAVWTVQSSWAGDLKISVPRRSELTPVQRLNRDGVEAVKKHEYEKAQAIFYKAYLYDPGDPFTLNNLGYVSELLGDTAGAQKFYTLASEQGCDAVVDISSARDLKGKPMTYAFSDLSNVKDVHMRVDHMNVQAVDLLSEDRNFEANRLLRQAAVLEPQDAFTLNNLGVAAEAMGDFADALKYYDEVASLESKEPIVVTLKRSLRGKPVSEAAASSARALRKRLQNLDVEQQQAILLEIQGVSAANRNDWATAKRDFLQAYSIDPGDAFALNNRGYVAEHEGDLETAQYYYSKARRADDSDSRVGLATRQVAQGQRLFAVATESGQNVDDELDEYTRTRREEKGPIELIPRNDNPGGDNSTTNGPSSNAPSSGSKPSAPQPQQ